MHSQPTHHSKELEERLGDERLGGEISTFWTRGEACDPPTGWMMLDKKAASVRV